MDGTKLDGPASLRNALLSRSDVFVRTVTEKLLTYATGRALKILRYAGGSLYRTPKPPRTTIVFRRFIQGIVQSDPFQMRMKQSESRSLGGQP